MKVYSGISLNASWPIGAHIGSYARDPLEGDWVVRVDSASECLGTVPGRRSPRGARCASLDKISNLRGGR